MNTIVFDFLFSFHISSEGTYYGAIRREMAKFGVLRPSFLLGGTFMKSA